MAQKKPTHYRIRVNRRFEFARANFRPGGVYTVKAAIYDKMNEEIPEVIASAEPATQEG